MPALIEFLEHARAHGVKVALSSWFREDEDNIRVLYNTPDRFADMWITTLRHIENAGLLDTLLFVDLCNEFPLRVWAPWLYTARLAQNVFRARPGDLAAAVPPRSKPHRTMGLGLDDRHHRACPGPVSPTRIHVFVLKRARHLAQAGRLVARPSGDPHLDGEQRIHRLLRSRRDDASPKNGVFTPGTATFVWNSAPAGPP